MVVKAARFVNLALAGMLTGNEFGSRVTSTRHSATSRRRRISRLSRP